MRRKKPKIFFNGWQDIPYATIGNKVYLGRTGGTKLRRRAKKSGLIVVTAKQWRQLIHSMQVIERLRLEGRWYDTVKL